LCCAISRRRCGASTRSHLQPYMLYRKYCTNPASAPHESGRSPISCSRRKDRPAWHRMTSCRHRRQRCTLLANTGPQERSKIVSNLRTFGNSPDRKTDDLHDYFNYTIQKNPGRKAKIITSISMFMTWKTELFVADVAKCLDEQGL